MNINDIECLVKQLLESMSWKDCLMECATLIHSCVDIFMHRYILNDDGILGKIKKNVISS
jgi:hypothetical protein